MKSYTEIHKLHNFFADTHPFIFYLFFCNFDTQIFKFSNLSLELHDVPIFWLEPDISGTLFLYLTHICLKRKGPATEMNLL